MQIQLKNRCKEHPERIALVQALLTRVMAKATTTDFKEQLENLGFALKEKGRASIDLEIAHDGTITFQIEERGEVVDAEGNSVREITTKTKFKVGDDREIEGFERSFEIQGLSVLD